MQITDIRTRVVSKESKMKAVVSVTFDDSFVVHDIKVIEGEKGLFIAMPSKKRRMGNTGMSLIRSMEKCGQCCRMPSYLNMSGRWQNCRKKNRTRR